MSDTPLRPAPREDALFAIARALDSRHAHNLNARIAAENVLAQMERHGLRVVYDPRHELPLPGIAPRRP